MSMGISEALAKCCEGAKEFALTAATWMGKTVTVVGSYLASTAQTVGSFFMSTAAKIAEFVKPHFEQLKTFAQENKQSIIIAAVACCVGSVLTAIFSRVCCSSGAPATTNVNGGSQEVTV